MTTPSLVVTNAGLAAAVTAEADGIQITLATFSVGSAYNYTPAPTDTALHGSILYTGAITSFSTPPDGSLIINCTIPYDAGPFEFGEVAIYTSGGALFALASLPALEQKYSSLGSEIPTTFTFSLYLLLAQGTGIFNINNDGSSTAPVITSIPSFTWDNATLTAGSGPNSAYTINYFSTDPGTYLLGPGRCTLSYDFLSTGFFSANPVAHFVTPLRHNNAITTSNDGHGCGIGNTSGFGSNFVGENTPSTPVLFLETFYGATTGSDNNVFFNAEATIPNQFQDGVQYRVKVDSTRAPEGAMFLRGRAWKQVVENGVNTWQLVIDTGDMLDGNPMASFVETGIAFATVFCTNVIPWTLAFTNVTVAWSGDADVSTDSSYKLSLYGGNMKGVLNWAPPLPIGASAIMGVGSANTNSLFVIGSANIIGFDFAPGGSERLVVFQSAGSVLVASPNFALPGGTNITVHADDCFRFISTGTPGAPSWLCTSYQPASGYSGGGSGGGGSYLPLSGGTMTGPVNWAFPDALTASPVMSIGASTSNVIWVTGTATITGFDNISSGVERVLIFGTAGSVIVNSTSLPLPGGSNITVAVDDCFRFISAGGGNWLCVSYQPASGYSGGGSSYLPLSGGTLTGAVNWSFPAVLSATSTMAIGAASSNYIWVNSAGTITGFDSIPAGAERTLVFQYPCTIVNSASLALPGGANLAVAAGDVITFGSANSGNWFCVNYQPAAGYTTGNYLSKTGGTMTGSLNWANPLPITAASVMAVGSANSNSLWVSGYATITNFDYAPGGSERLVVFGTAGSILVNSATFALPGGANITAGVNDCFRFISTGSLGSPSWLCTSYQPAAGGSGGGVSSFNTRTGAITLTSSDVTSALSYTPVNPAVATFTGTPTAPTATAGTNTTQIATTAFVHTSLTSYLPIAGGTLSGSLNWAPPLPITAASVMAVGSANTNSLFVSGTGASITNFDYAPSGSERLIVFQSSGNTLVNSATFALPGGVNIAAQADDCFRFISTGTIGSPSWLCTSYQPAAGYSGGGGGGGSGVSSFNSRTGAVTLTTSDITSALTYSPANIASPAFSGTPTAPTAAAGTNTTQIATTAFVHNYLPLAGGLMTGPVNWAFPAAITTTSSMAIGAASSNVIWITGAGTINGFDVISSGVERLLVFGTAGIVVVNSASLVLPGGANITVAVDDTMRFVSTGGGNWLCTNYQPAAGYSGGGGGSGVSSFNSRTGAVTLTSSDVTTALGYTPISTASPAFTGVPTAPTAAAGTNTTQLATTAFVHNYLPLSGGTMSGALNYATPVIVAAASTTAIGAAAGNVVWVTGTATISSFDTILNGGTRIVVFASSGSVLVASSTLVLPGGASITVNANDVFEFVCSGTNAWICTSYKSQAGQVITFNGRQGAISMNSGDVTSALGYTPYNSSNPSGFITSSGSISGSSGSCTGNAASATSAPNYLPLAGGYLSGAGTQIGSLDGNWSVRSGWQNYNAASYVSNSSNMNTTNWASDCGVGGISGLFSTYYGGAVTPAGIENLVRPLYCVVCMLMGDLMDRHVF